MSLTSTITSTSTSAVPQRFAGFGGFFLQFKNTTLKNSLLASLCSLRAQRQVGAIDSAGTDPVPHTLCSGRAGQLAENSHENTEEHLQRLGKAQGWSTGKQTQQERHPPLHPASSSGTRPSPHPETGLRAQRVVETVKHKPQRAAVVGWGEQPRSPQPPPRPPAPHPSCCAGAGRRWRRRA